MISEDSIRIRIALFLRNKHENQFLLLVCFLFYLTLQELFFVLLGWITSVQTLRYLLYSIRSCFYWQRHPFPASQITVHPILKMWNRDSFANSFSVTKSNITLPFFPRPNETTQTATLLEKIVVNMLLLFHRRTDGQNWKSIRRFDRWEHHL